MPAAGAFILATPDLSSQGTSIPVASAVALSELRPPNRIKCLRLSFFLI